jgi:cytochrome c peroxidase
MRYLVFLFLFISFLFACKKNKVAIDEYKLSYPSHFPEPHYSFENNEITKERFELGKKLFFDPLLSIDNTISCGSCHAQTHAFADHNVSLSSGVNGALGTRNSPSIANMIWQKSFLWDGGVNHLEMFSIAPILNPVEMNETIPGILAKLNNSSFYKNAFQKAYGVDEINDQVLFRSLTVFMAMIVSADSKYDKWRQGNATLSTKEKAGLELFRQHCASCHSEPLFTDHSFRNNGLDSEFNDLGRALITLDPSDQGKFKVPSLRNVELTYPYMHDGRFWSLQQVMDHYASGIHSSATLDPVLTNGIVLSDTEKEQLIAFLKTLTDYSLLNNKLLFE